MSYIEAIVLGITQGITEWLPISSEGAIILIKVNFFQVQTVSSLIQEAVFLHLGTFFAALVYFRKDVRELFVALFSYKTSTKETRSTLRFLLISTIISGALGFLILKFIGDIGAEFLPTAKVITAGIGFLLLITALLLLTASRKAFSTRKESDITAVDSIILGVTQGFTALPGLSRSGLTVSALLLRKVEESDALRLSFLMSLPIVFGANILLGFRSISFSLPMLVALLFSFVFGILTIGALLRLAKKINFGYFVLVFALLSFASLLI